MNLLLPFGVSSKNFESASLAEITTLRGYAIASVESAGELLSAAAVAEAPVARCSTAQKSRRLVPFYDSCSIQLDANFFKQQLR